MKARIKKIMQKDDDVGKVAQATPVVISKALELFLALVVEKAGSVTKERGSKKVEAYHLKHAVETTDTFDFLKEIVESVPDPSAGGTIDLDAVKEENMAKKKRSKGKKAATANGEDGAPAPKRRKKKVKSEQAAEEEGGEDTVMADSGEPEPNGDEEDEEKARQASDEDEDEDDQWKNDRPFIPSR
ncbi:hypothetical protein D9757_007984 [Collybiopsis confluens]|uniref:Transcription factor CBF/NF-Y/archaeal histone domain-containing protein n=1 Tax=Collybiopsis confluens TaxID=2823264 RepID=A0A8H5H620_9AGAR|nr:hypothetical protein D9757_007984 [Collybiopsis confluens]